MDQHVSLYETDTTKNCGRSRGWSWWTSKTYREIATERLSEKEPCVTCSLEKSIGLLIEERNSLPFVSPRFFVNKEKRIREISTWISSHQATRNNLKNGYAWAQIKTNRYKRRSPKMGETPPHPLPKGEKCFITQFPSPGPISQSTNGSTLTFHCSGQ